MRRRSSICWSSASDGCRRVECAKNRQKMGAGLAMALPVSPPSTTAQERLMAVAIGHTDDDYEAWAHRDDAHAYGKRRRHTHRVDASSRPCFLSYSKRQGARTTSRCGSRRLVIVSIYPYVRRVPGSGRSVAAPTTRGRATGRSWRSL